ncbi:sialidase family protein [Streptomyces sp. SDT5-1]|uniref:sialidase family protein n=1 Tax=Streptomyces sp. SDT5-1 TaxID=3406418 RepID=UPI003FD32E9B
MAASAPAPTPAPLRPVPDDPDRQETFLPAPTAQAHAANLMPLADGSLGCAWFGGTQEGMPDIHIWFSKLGADGAWTDPVRVTSDTERSEQNPVLFPTPDGELWLIHTAQVAGNQDTAEVRVTVSRDDGATWSPARTLAPASAEGGVFVRHPVHVMDSGRWLLPVFHCPRPAVGRWRGDEDTSAVLSSDDKGATWQHHAVPYSTGCVHMNIVPLDDGTLLALFRRRQADTIHLSRSTDGVTWTEPVPTELPNNNSSIQVTALRDGRLVVAHNASSAADATARRTSLYDEIDDDGGLAGAGTPGPEQPAGAAFWGAPRAPMTLALSEDGGHTWPHRRDVETGDGYCLTNNSREGLNRELSYPSLTQTADGALHLAYTHHRRAIKHVRVTPRWITS